MKSLIRTRVNEFNIEDAIELEKLEEIKDVNIKSTEEVFCNFDKVILDNKQEKELLNGIKTQVNNIDGVYRIYNNNEFIGLGILQNKLLRRDIIIKDEINKK